MESHSYSGKPSMKAMVSPSKVRSSANLNTERGLLNNHRNQNSPSSNKKKRNHIVNLKGITARLLKEETELRSAIERASSFKNGKKNKNKSKTKIIKAVPAVATKTPEAIEKLKPWVESPSTVVEETTWIETSPTEIVAIQHSDTMTERTALCSAFEMLSFENFCNRQSKSLDPQSPETAGTEQDVEPFKVVGHSPAEDDGFVVPREISFTNHGICANCVDSGVGCSSILREELVIKRQKSKKFIKRLQNSFRPGKNADKSTRVMKVKVYVDPPKPMGSNNSLGASTVTMPNELQRTITNTTI